MQVYGIQFDPKWEEKDYNYREVERILEAEKIGLYQPVDYSSYPQEYCGELIDSTPLNL